MRKTIFTISLLITAVISFGQWQQLNVPSGGYIRNIIFDGSTMYAASGGSVLTSDNDVILGRFVIQDLNLAILNHLPNYAIMFLYLQTKMFSALTIGLNWESAGTEPDGFM